MALSDETGPCPSKAPVVKGSDLPLPQPVENLRLLGDTPGEQWDTIARYSAASYQTPPRELVGLLDKVSKVGQVTLPAPVESELPSPVPQYQQPEAISVTAPIYEPPEVKAGSKHILYGMEESDPWEADLHSVFDGADEEASDIFA